MLVNKKNAAYYFITVILVAVISIFSGYRSQEIGDTYQYMLHYERIFESGSYIYKLELGFSLLAYLVSLVGGNYILFFFVVTFVITAAYLFLFRKAYISLVSNQVLFTDILLFLSLLVLSSWYLTSITNGLRQGLSLPFLYLSLFFFVFHKSLWKSVLLFVLSVSFHYSSFLVLPFLILALLKLNYVLLAWLVLAMGYVLGLNEIAVKIVSDLTSFSVYEKIKFYSVDIGVAGRYDGFIWSFFLYTVFWPVLFLAVHYLNCKSFCEDKYKILGLMKMYFILSMPYFVFGFGPFSNRYSYIAWFFIPLLQCFLLLYYSSDARRFSRWFSLLVFLVAFMFFILYLDFF